MKLNIRIWGVRIGIEIITMLFVESVGVLITDFYTRMYCFACIRGVLEEEMDSGTQTDCVLR